MLDEMFDSSDATARRTQLDLLELNRLRLTPATPCHLWRENLNRIAGSTLLEGDYIEDLRAAIAEEAADVPTQPHEFISWFNELERTGPGQHDHLFPWLAERASLDQMKWFLTQEVAGEAGFEDLTAITQVRLPSRPKLEMARNYWDEMGRGNGKAMHGPLLQALSDALELRPDPTQIVPEALMLGNLMAGLAHNRRYAYHSVGALGAVELTAPGRASLVNAGLKRLGCSASVRHYFSLHAVLDVRHSQTWNAEVILPLVEQDPAIATAIAEGALMRLHRGAACFERYRAELW
jgi:hypothetical protein